MEQVAGFEPTTLTWKESVLPTKLNLLTLNKYAHLNYELPCDNYYIAKRTSLTLLQSSPKKYSWKVQNP